MRERIGVYFCRCGANISDSVDPEGVQAGLKCDDGEVHYRTVDFMCSEEGKEFLRKDIQENAIDRVVVSACSPREHEGTFMRVLSDAGRNPYLMQMVNIREQIAWVTEDRTQATEKATRAINAAMRRVLLHDPLEKKEIDISPEVLIIGAGPAGLKAAMSIAEAGRKVVVVEKSPVIGGMAVRYEELFPSMECSPCMLEPLLGDLLHGGHAEDIELLTLAEVVEVVGSYGNFNVKIKKQARYVDVHTCIGCGECMEPCPVSKKNIFNCGLNEVKAISLPFAGALPNAPFIDGGTCLRMTGEDCHRCLDACPMEGAICFEDKEDIVERTVGAIIVATGSDVYDCGSISNLGYSALPDVVNAVEFERILASNGPTGGEIKTASGNAPESVAIVHCVASLDRNHKEYCSGICCQYAFKFNRLITKKLPGTKIYHFYKELSLPGKEGVALYQDVRNNQDTTFIRYSDIADLNIKEKDGKRIVEFKDTGGEEGFVPVDMVVLCPAVVPADDSGKLGALLEAVHGKFGFFEELHGRMDSAQSNIKGIYLAGTCQSPMDIQGAMNQGMAASGYILSGLAAGRKLEIKPIVAVVNADRCSGCRVCISVCPYKAASFDTEREISVINDLLCQGCGTCVAACPSGSIKGNHFTTEEIYAEIEEVLQ